MLSSSQRLSEVVATSPDPPPNFEPVLPSAVEASRRLVEAVEGRGAFHEYPPVAGHVPFRLVKTRHSMGNIMELALDILGSWRSRPFWAKTRKPSKMDGLGPCTLSEAAGPCR